MFGICAGGCKQESFLEAQRTTAHSLKMCEFKEQPAMEEKALIKSIENLNLHRKKKRRRKKNHEEVEKMLY